MIIVQMLCTKGASSNGYSQSSNPQPRLMSAHPTSRIPVTQPSSSTPAESSKARGHHFQAGRAQWISTSTTTTPKADRIYQEGLSRDTLQLRPQAWAPAAMASGTRFLPRSSTAAGRTGGVSRISAGRCRSTTCLQCRPGGACCCRGCFPLELEARRRAPRPPAPMAASPARSWCLPAATTSTRRRLRTGYAEGRCYQAWVRWCRLKVQEVLACSI